MKVQREKMIDIYLRVRLEVPLRKLKLAYCNRVGLDCDEIRFTFDGTRIGDQQTAGDLEMEDGDVIDAWSDQWGGSGGASASCCIWIRSGVCYLKFEQHTRSYILSHKLKNSVRYRYF